MIVVLALVILFACIAALFTEGLWGCAVTFVNVLLSTLLATILYEPMANALEGMMPTYTNLLDFIALWGLFAAFAALIRLATDKLSKVKVRFIRPVDIAGGVFFSAWIGWILICFTLMSLHVAPLARSPFGGGFMETPDSKALGIGPDRLWLAFIHKQSKEALGRGDAHVFDSRGRFIYDYAQRRYDLERSPSLRQKPN